MGGRARTWLGAGAAALLAAAVAAPATGGERAAVAIVVSATWEDARSIDLPTLRQLYLGRRSRWRGERVECFHLGAGTAIREGFDRAVLGRSAAALDAYWIEQALLGGARPPREYGSEAQVLRRVRQRAGNVGYVDHGRLAAGGADGIRVLAVIRDGRALAPGDPGYPIGYAAPEESP